MALPSTEDIVDDLSFFDDWEDKYKYIIDLGKSLPEFDESDHLDCMVCSMSLFF